MPPNLDHDQLLTLLQEVNQDPQPPSTNVPSSLPRSTGHKATEKRKNISTDQADPTPKKGKTASASFAAVQGEDKILSALLSIQGTLSAMDNRIQALESQRSSPAPQAGIYGQTSSLTSNRAISPDLALPS